MSEVAIIGSGVMGSAMAWPLVDNGHSVSLIGSVKDDDIIYSCKKEGFHPTLKRNLPKGVKAYYFSEIKTVIDEIDIIVNGVSSEGIEWFSGMLPSIINENKKILSITKGFRITKEGEIKIFPELILENVSKTIRDKVVTVAVGGPCIAGELAGKRQSCVYFGSKKQSDSELFINLFKTIYYHPIPTEKLLSLEICVALKNAYALAVGIASGIAEMKEEPDHPDVKRHNEAAAIFAEACYEINFILRKFKGIEIFSSSLPGAGDLYVTSTGGRTITLGKLLGKGIRFDEAKKELKGITLESVQIIRQMDIALTMWEKQGIIENKDLPLIRMLTKVINGELTNEIPFDKFFKW